ncbi:anaerobic ribonucleoside-triphosphate reductase activating protein [Acidobacteriota bacterium]
MVEIKGLEKFAPKDFPGHISSTFFVGGCNFRCPFCHNSQLVLEPENLPSFPMDYALSYLDSRKGWLEGVCVTGGEPLIHEELDVLLQIIKDREFLVKIDTNGAFPDRLRELIENELVDHVAIDIKTSPKKYAEAVKVPVDFGLIEESVSLVVASGLDHTIRTTAVPTLVDTAEIEEIGGLFKDVRTFQLQQYFPDGALDPEFRKLVPYPSEKISELGKGAESFFPEVRIEGI